MRILQNQTQEDSFIYWNDDPVIKKELDKYDIKAVKCPFSELKEKGSIGYIEEGQYKIEYPTPFNMEQEELSLTGKHNIYNSLAAGIASNIAGIKKEEIRKSLSDFPGVEHIVYLGADNKKLHDFFDGMGIPVADTHSMKDCVEACEKMAKPGYTVLLSPCCASFDLFKNMEDRGEQFKTLVRNL